MSLSFSLSIYKEREKGKILKTNKLCSFLFDCGQDIDNQQVKLIFEALLCLFAWRLACSLKQPMLGPVSRRKAKGNQYVVQCPFLGFPLFALSLFLYKVVNQIADVISAAVRPDFFRVQVCAVLNPCNIFGRVFPPLTACLIAVGEQMPETRSRLRFRIACVRTRASAAPWWTG